MNRSILLLIFSIFLTTAALGANTQTDGRKAPLLQKKTSAYHGPKQGDIITNGIGMKLVYIPAGDFMMGSNDGASNEQPVHKVTISKGFYMGVTEVTQAQYQALMDANPSIFKGDNYPVERVNRDDAMEFCRKLSQRDGKTYALPTEAQWEYACRAGSTTEYSFGSSESELHKHGNYCDKSNTTGYDWQDKQHDDGYDKTAAVGSYRPNKFGLYDMHGNVWEWCTDWFDEDYYSKGGAVDPENTQSTGFHLLRGGNWRNWASVCRSATRFRLTPGYRSNSVGFRVVIEVESNAPYQMPSPKGWGTERIKLPPPFAPKMNWKGHEDLRFAPGMFNPKSDSFLSYDVLFWTKGERVPTQKDLQQEYDLLPRTLQGPVGGTQARLQANAGGRKTQSRRVAR